jgi:hypothetical protein
MFLSLTSDNIANQLASNENIQDKLKSIIAEITQSNIFQQKAQSITKIRRTRNSWNDEEIQKLIVGVSLIGIGKWSSIHSALSFDSERTPTDLKDKWRNLINPKSNSKSQLHFKKLAKYVEENLNQTLITIGRNPQNLILDWKNVFHELEMIENQNFTIQDTNNENVENISFSQSVETNQIEDWNSEQFDYENFQYFY